MRSPAGARAPKERSRRAKGGAAVNLTPGSEPADVYTRIANLVAEHVAKDMRHSGGGRGERDAPLAAALQPHVDRQLVQQTVMTSVYGVTFVGARQQIQNRLKERGALPDERERFRVSNYAARKTLAALADMFYEARQVQACARAACSALR